MARTQGPLYADTPHTGGWVWASALDLPGVFSAGVISALLVQTRNALGDYSFNRTAAGAETYVAAIQFTNNIARLIELTSSSSAGFPFQEQFGTSTGTAGWPAGAPGAPPFTGASQLTVPTGDTPKGFKVTNVAVVYQVGVLALTSASVTLQRTVYANNVANAITAITVTGAAPLAVQANPYVFVSPVTTPVFETTDTASISAEFNFVMASTGTIRLYGLGVHVTFNYN